MFNGRSFFEKLSFNTSTKVKPLKKDDFHIVKKNIHIVKKEYSNRKKVHKVYFFNEILILRKIFAGKACRLL